VISWKHSFKRLNEEYEIAKKKKQALDNLFTTGKISQSTRDSFNSDITAAIVEIERQQKALLEKMQIKTDELAGQIKTLESLLANYEIQHVVGEIEEETYQREILLLTTGLETARNELDTIKLATMQLCAPVQTVQAPAAPEVPAAPAPVIAESVTVAAPAPVTFEAAPEIAPAETEIATAEPMIEEPTMECAPVEEASAEFAVEAAIEAPVEVAPEVEAAPIETPIEAESAPIETPTFEAAPADEITFEAEAPMETAPIEEAPIETPIEEAAPVEETIETPVFEAASFEETTPEVEEAAPIAPTEPEFSTEEPAIEIATSDPVFLASEPTVEEEPVMEAAPAEETIVEAAFDEVSAETAPVEEAAVEMVEEQPAPDVPLQVFEVTEQAPVEQTLEKVMEQFLSPAVETITVEELTHDSHPSTAPHQAPSEIITEAASDGQIDESDEDKNTTE
jgi:hypothetical protein